MKSYMYSFEDFKANVWSVPSGSQTSPDDMKEIFARMVNARDFDKYVDYDGRKLWCLGVFDDNTGYLTLFDKPQFVIDCDSVCSVAIKNKEVKKDV